MIPFLMKGKTPKDMWSHQLLKDIGWPAWLQKGQVTLRGVGVGGPPGGFYTDTADSPFRK